MRRALPPILAVCALAGCGGEGDGFTADQFVDAVNQRGASLVLGAELPSTRADAEVYALELRTPATGPGGAEAHGGGSLAVMPDADAGLEEWKRCREAASLVCYRADNIVLLLEEVEPVQRAVLNAALLTMRAETGG